MHFSKKRQKYNTCSSTVMYSLSGLSNLERGKEESKIDHDGNGTFQVSLLSFNLKKVGYRYFSWIWFLSCIFMFKVSSHICQSEAVHVYFLFYVDCQDQMSRGKGEFERNPYNNKKQEGTHCNFSILISSFFLSEHFKNFLSPNSSLLHVEFLV